MSIRGEMEALCRTGLLAEYVTDPPGLRRVYVSESIAYFLETPGLDPGVVEASDQLAADLADFIAGEEITVVMKSKKKKDSIMKLLVGPPDEIWELRSVSSRPGLRVFGRFAEKNVFVALAYQDRCDLGPIDSRNWAFWMRRCEEEWDKRFPEHDPLTGGCVDDYLSNAIKV